MRSNVLLIVNSMIMMKKAFCYRKVEENVKGTANVSNVS